MLADWNTLPDSLQLVLAQEALRRAADIIAHHAEILAEEIDDGALPDRGGPDALRLLAGIARMSGSGGMPAAGTA